MLVSAATRQVVSGEICQTFLRGDACLSLEQYFRIIRLKTAELFEVSCRLGALLSGGTAGSFPSGSSGSLSAGAGNVAFADAAALFGRHLGIAYQIFDDITDFVGDEARIGKTLGTDLASGKFTLPALLYLQTLPATDANALVKKLADNSVTPAQFVSQMRTAGIPAACSTFLFNELESATGALAPFAGTPAATLLNNLANYVRERFQALNI
jgi:octaprenyl-diphosphate synthase